MIHGSSKTHRSIDSPMAMPMKLSLVDSYNKGNIFIGIIEYDVNSLLGASHLVYHTVHIRFDLE